MLGTITLTGKNDSMRLCSLSFINLKFYSTLQKKIALKKVVAFMQSKGNFFDKKRIYFT